MTEIYQADTVDLLRGVKKKVLNNRHLFPGLRAEFTKIGFLGYRPLLPAVAIMPVSWNKIKEQSGGRYVAARTIELQLYASGRSNSEAHDKLKEFVERLRTLIQNEDKAFFFEDESQTPQSFSFEFLPVSFPDTPVRVNEEAVSQANFQLSLLSRDYRPAQMSKPAVEVHSELKEEADAVFRRLFQNRTSRLREVKEFRRDSRRPKAQGMTVNVYLDNQNPQRYAAGADLYDSAYAVDVRTKLLPDEFSLFKNVSTCETIKDILDEDETFGGIFWNSSVDSMIYGEDESDRASFYMTRIQLSARTVRSTEFRRAG